MSAQLSAAAPLTDEERKELIVVQEALEEQLRDVRAKLGEQRGPDPASAPVVNASVAEDVPTAAEETDLTDPLLKLEKTRKPPVNADWFCAEDPYDTAKLCFITVYDEDDTGIQAGISCLQSQPEP